VKLFISYRREDSQDITGRIYDRFVTAFGISNVFKDVNSIPFGDDFRNAIEQGVKQSDIFIEIIGPRWLSITDSSGRPKIESADDFVRKEIEAALKRDIALIPLLVDGASMPKPSELPESIRELSFRNAISINHDPAFQDDIDRLISSINSRKSEPAYSMDGYCYISRDMINELYTKFGIPVLDSATYRKKIDNILLHLDSMGLLSTVPIPETGSKRFVFFTFHFEFIEDDEEYLSFRCKPYLFTMSMSKAKSTFWPYQSKMNRLSHVRLALKYGIELQVFGEWYSSDYLRPYSAKVVGYNLSDFNTLV
jgi:TIR domain-containing protein